jgi:hypothetical protein
MDREAPKNLNCPPPYEETACAALSKNRPGPTGAQPKEPPMEDTNAERLRRDPPQIMNQTEAAAYLSISPRKLWNETYARHVKAVRIGRRVLYRLQDLQQYLDLLSARAA